MKHGTITLLVAAALSLAATAAAADGPPVRAATQGDGYLYAFDDDPMTAGGLGPLGARILIATRADRSTLIRPRTQFVIDLVRSVEKL
jgi:hypothetical protein